MSSRELPEAPRAAPRGCQHSSSDGFRVLIVEPAQVVRAGLRAILQSAPGISVVGEAATSAEALRLADGSALDAALVGLHPTDADASSLIRGIVERRWQTGVIVLQQEASVDSLIAALRAGARGYLSRDVEREFLLDAIRVVSQGGAIIDPAVAEGLTTSLAVGLDLRSESKKPATATPFDKLSGRERDVLGHLALGLSNTEIAAALGMQTGTVKTHLHHIFRKLGVSDRTSAALAASRMIALSARTKEDRSEEPDALSPSDPAAAS